VTPRHPTHTHWLPHLQRPSGNGFANANYTARTSSTGTTSYYYYTDSSSADDDFFESFDPGFGFDADEFDLDLDDEEDVRGYSRVHDWVKDTRSGSYQSSWQANKKKKAKSARVAGAASKAGPGHISIDMDDLLSDLDENTKATLRNVFGSNMEHLNDISVGAVLGMYHGWAGLAGGGGGRTSLQHMLRVA
jgi:hypothetical protein